MFDVLKAVYQVIDPWPEPTHPYPSNSPWVDSRSKVLGLEIHHHLLQLLRGPNLNGTQVELVEASHGIRGGYEDMSNSRKFTTLGFSDVLASLNCQ